MSYLAWVLYLAAISSPVPQPCHRAIDKYVVSAVIEHFQEPKNKKTGAQAKLYISTVNDQFEEPKKGDCTYSHLENYFFISLSLSLCLLPVFKRFFIIHCHLERSQNKVKCIHPEQTCLTFADSGTIFFQNHSIAVSIFVIILSVFDKN